MCRAFGTQKNAQNDTAYIQSLGTYAIHRTRSSFFEKTCALNSLGQPSPAWNSRVRHEVGGLGPATELRKPGASSSVESLLGAGPLRSPDCFLLISVFKGFMDQKTARPLRIPTSV